MAMAIPDAQRQARQATRTQTVQPIQRTRCALLMKRPNLTPKRLNHYSHASKSAAPADEFVHWRDTNYTGAELKPFTGRPGAMDAYSLPSLHCGQRVERVTC